MYAYEITARLNEEELSLVTGGKVNKNVDPGNLTRGVDIVINGKNYDALAQRIADFLCPPSPRTRKVNNDVDINDCDI